MTTPENTENPENPDENGTPDNPDAPEEPKNPTPKKTTRRTRRTGKKDDSETLKDTQKVVQKSREQLGSSASPGKYLHQTSQFDVQSPHPDVLNHLANPTEAALKARDASDAKLRGEEDK